MIKDLSMAHRTFVYLESTPLCKRASKDAPSKDYQE
jgi:hypothetical protein